MFRLIMGGVVIAETLTLLGYVVTLDKRPAFFVLNHADELIFALGVWWVSIGMFILATDAGLASALPLIVLGGAATGGAGAAYVLRRQP